MKLKKIPLYLLFLILVYSCGSQNLEEKNMIVTLSAQTRGASKIIIITNIEGGYKTLHQEKLFSLSDKEKQQLNSFVSNVNLSEISQLIAPSQKRFSDGALAADLEIQIGEKIYNSSQFDYDNPPKELKNLIGFLKSLIE